jgi:hypothetical protein
MLGKTGRPDLAVRLDFLSRAHDSPIVNTLTEMNLDTFAAELALATLTHQANRFQDSSRRFLGGFLTEEQGELLRELGKTQGELIEQFNASLQGRLERNRNNFVTAIDAAKTRSDLSMILKSVKPDLFVEQLGVVDAEQLTRINRVVANLCGKIRRRRLQFDLKSLESR